MRKITEVENWCDEIQNIISASKYLTDKQCDHIWDLSEQIRIKYQKLHSRYIEDTRHEPLL